MTNTEPTTEIDTALLADFRRYRKTRDPALREHLLLHEEHQKLVRFWANYYHAANWTLEDKMQEGQIGLLKAIDRYDPDGLHQGRAFRTVASFAIQKPQRQPRQRRQPQQKRTA